LKSTFHVWPYKLDLLSDLFREAGLQRRLLDLRRLTPRRALRFPCERSIGLHVVTHGRAWLHAPTLESPITLEAGDIAVMGRGCTHLLAASAEVDDAEVATVAPTGADFGADADAGLGDVTVISGAYQLWHAPVHPFFSEMPPWHVLRAGRLAQIGPLPLTLALLDEEVRRHDLGAQTVVHALLDVVFTYLLRAIVEERGNAVAGWSQALHDPQVRRAIAAMHGDVARPWTLDELARIAGMSRTGFAERFRNAMGDTPLAYLRDVRMQRAMRLLSGTEQKLEAVAAAVGYQDAFGFSKVFKRVVGVSPKAFRLQDASERQMPWRLAAS
jgi:AraC-like DNA-binding protein